MSTSENKAPKCARCHQQHEESILIVFSSFVNVMKIGMELLGQLKTPSATVPYQKIHMLNILRDLEKLLEYLKLQKVYSTLPTIVTK
jgi:hypothetical protein